MLGNSTFSVRVDIIEKHWLSHCRCCNLKTRILKKASCLVDMVAWLEVNHMWLLGVSLADVSDPRQRAWRTRAAATLGTALAPRKRSRLDEIRS